MFSVEVLMRARCIPFKQLALIVLMTAYFSFQATAAALPAGEQSDVVAGKLQDAIANLSNIQQSIESRRLTVRELRERLKLLEDPSERQEIEQKIERSRNEILELQQSFEDVVLGGINLPILTDKPDQQMDWKAEFEEIIRPLLSTLKELTAKPRQVDSLRRTIEQREDQLRIMARALDSIEKFKQEPLPETVASSIEELQIVWEQHRVDTQRELEIARFRLSSLEAEQVPWRTTVSESFRGFFKGRGLTLILAVLASLTVWVVFRVLLALYWRWLYRVRSDIGVTRAPLVLYSYRLATAVFIVLAIILVLYIRGDVLLLTLAMIALVGVALSLRQTLPRYAAELRLLLGVGPVREQERIMLDGVPYNVESLSIYTVLRNPALEGVMRLPLHDMNTYVSRPAANEPWFPTEPGDYLLFADGSYGKVLRQTIEMVEVAIRDTTVQVNTKNFISQNIRNLSRDGFGIASIFGIDYRHQSYSLDRIPGRLSEAIRSKFRQAGLGAFVRDILVEFKEAGASSLDYQIYIVLDGQAANGFYKAQRLIQQACVNCCNEEGWVIPFTQITVHTNDHAV